MSNNTNKEVKKEIKKEVEKQIVGGAACTTIRKSKCGEGKKPQ